MPLVFLHGLGLNGRAYVRWLSNRRAGFHRDRRRRRRPRRHRQLTLRALDALGVNRAVFLGHSMGGRMIVDLASRAPQRVLAVVLLNAAAGAALARNARVPLGSTGALRAIIGSGDFAWKLGAMRRHRVPTIVVHSENGGLVPFVNAVDMAERTDGALYRVPGAHHSWMLAHPGEAAELMAQLLSAELGTALREAGGDETIGMAG